MDRQFPDEELARLTAPLEARAIAALEQDDDPALDDWLQRMETGHLGLHMLSIHTLARKAGMLRRDHGETKAREELLRIGAQLMATWVRQYRTGDYRGAIADLVAVYVHQAGAVPQPLEETDDAVVLDLSPCGSGGRLEQDGFADKHPEWYGGWRDGVSSLCQACKACQGALNSALGETVWSTEKGSGGHCRMRFAKPSGQTAPLFSDQERTALVTTRVQSARARLAAGGRDIRELLEGQRQEWRPWHDFAVAWLACFYGTALESGGADYLDAMLAETFEPAFQVGFPRYAALSDAELVHEVAQTWHYHCADFSVREESDRFVFTLDPCGSGGRLFRGELWRGLLNYGDDLVPIMDEPHPVNFHRVGAPSYCTHCAAANRAQFAGHDAGAAPLFFMVDGHAQILPGQPCRQFSYKKGVSGGGVAAELRKQIAPNA